MLEAVNADNYAAFAALCARDNFGCRILSTYQTYGADPSLVTLFSGNGALSLRGGSAVVCGAYSAEMADCLTFLGFRELFAPETFPPFAGVREVSRGPVAALARAEAGDYARAEAIDAETLREIYPVIVSDLPEILNQPFDEWYVELSHRLRHGGAHILAVRENGGVVSTAMTAAETETAAVIGFVRTLSAYRRRGYAGGLCRALGRALLRGGKRVYLCCEEAMLPFYQALGYRREMDWWYGTRKNEEET